MMALELPRFPFLAEVREHHVQIGIFRRPVHIPLELLDAVGITAPQAWLVGAQNDLAHALIRCERFGDRLRVLQLAVRNTACAIVDALGALWRIDGGFHRA
ncbi:hypothetical protein SDC9_134717 [bioreactor metagenome]|uniref:Uncharacterized protein n=1 Tax=bioreactor metagenome TaxID=1076179 RepID=A0A645DEC5_9ZZZZ